MSDETKTMGVGRADHDERRERRADRLHERAAKARAESEAAYGRSSQIADRIPMGQPVLVGHHSEKRHRRDLDKIDSAMRRSVEKQREAERLQSAAASAESNTSISSDDPEALVRLREKLEGMEAEREEIKRQNRLARKGDPEVVAMLTERYKHVPWQDPRKGYPSYVLKNLGGNIRRVKERIASMERQAKREPRETEIGGIEVRENPETNRVELDLGRRATKEEYRTIKSMGFKWSRYNEVWQRLANDSAWHCGVRLAEQLSEKGK